MVLHRQFPIGLLDFLLGSVAIDAKHLVIVAFRHSDPSCLPGSPLYFFWIQQGVSRKSAPPLTHCPFALSRRFLVVLHFLIFRIYHVAVLRLGAAGFGLGLWLGCIPLRLLLRVHLLRQLV